MSNSEAFLAYISNNVEDGDEWEILLLILYSFSLLKNDLYESLF